VALSPALSSQSDVVFEYENPTPTGDSRNRTFAAEDKISKKNRILFFKHIYLNYQCFTKNLKKKQMLLDKFTMIPRKFVCVKCFAIAPHTKWAQLLHCSNTQR